MEHTIIYPAIFSKEGNAYNVTFPDVPEAITFGENLTEAVEMAQSALGLAVYDKSKLPAATNPEAINLTDKHSFITMITLDLAEYRRNNHS